MFVVRLYGYDHAAGREALMEERELTSEAEARQCARNLEAGGAGLVTYNRMQPAT